MDICLYKIFAPVDGHPSGSGAFHTKVRSVGVYLHLRLRCGMHVLVPHLHLELVVVVPAEYVVQVLEL